MKPYRGRLHFDGSIRHELHAAITAEEPPMERNIAMTFLFLSFSGIAWALSKFALIFYREARHKVRAWRVKPMLHPERLRRVK